MDDLIVIILTLVVAGIGVFGQFKKKKQAPVENGETKTPESLWDLFQGDSNQQQPAENQDYEEYGYEQYEEPIVQKVEVKTEAPKYQFTAKNERQSIVKDKSPVKVKKSKLRSGIRKDFSLRKAVIYSEILNRKYS